MRDHPREPTFICLLLASLEYRAQPHLEPRPPAFGIRARKAVEHTFQVANVGSPLGCARLTFPFHQLAKLPQATGRQVISRLFPTSWQPRRPCAVVELLRKLGTARCNAVVADVELRIEATEAGVQGRELGIGGRARLPRHRRLPLADRDAANQHARDQSAKTTAAEHVSSLARPQFAVPDQSPPCAPADLRTKPAS